jgi:predicted DNA-binding protein YlxM (UPF0122 family)
MAERERVMKRSCAFCQSEDRDALEDELQQGLISTKELDKKMEWRANTADRHFRNHMGDYVKAANPSCPICSHPNRADIERSYYEGSISSDEIANETNVPESTIYHHMKMHFQPLVQRSAALEVALQAGTEIQTLRQNVEGLNHKLQQLLGEGSVHEDGFVRDAVSLHKEVRESVKDLLKFEEKWAEPEAQTVNQTINVLKVELAQESPEVWRRVKKRLLEQGDDIEVIE